MAQTPQTYKNHARFFPLFHFFAAPVLLINLVNAGRNLYLQPSPGTAWAVVVAAALVALALAARLMALTVQDRVIRLEMRLRMQQVLPADLCARAGELTPPQLVALRFASTGARRPVRTCSRKAGDPEASSVRKELTADYLRAQRARAVTRATPAHRAPPTGRALPSQGDISA